MDSKIKVLLVDDEEQFRSATEKILKKRGFDVILAADGEAGIEKVQENPDVVVLDIKMPGKGGLEVLQEIKKASPALPIIMLTGHGSEPSAQTALEGGAHDFLNKPCDIDLLASKIAEAHRAGKKGAPAEESRVKDVMIPSGEYTSLSSRDTVKEAIQKLKESFSSKGSPSSIMETGHRSVLVVDDKGRVDGVLAIIDLIQAIMPAYLKAPKPSMADSIQYSPMFWSGMFTHEIIELGRREIGDIMSPAPPMVRAGASLMEASYLMVKSDARRLVVMEEGKVVGMLREQDLFFEMERILRN